MVNGWEVDVYIPLTLRKNWSGKLKKKKKAKKF